jgi:hypothetical protein
MGRCLDGRPGLEFVDIGLIGEWGEMHLGLHIPDRWTSEQLHETGFSHAKYVAAYRRIIDAFAEAFPHTQVFLNVGDHREINEYAAIRGIHFRQDGLKPSGPSANVGERFYIPWSRRGIKGNYEFHSSLESMRHKGWDLHATVLKGLEAPISYLNTNIYSVHGLANATDEARRELTLAGRRVGFRFLPTKVRYLEGFHVAPGRPSRVLIEHVWKNVGVAPCYESYALRFSLVEAAGNRVAESICFPGVPTTEWWPAAEVTLRSIARFESEIRPGQYTLKIGMCLPEDRGHDVLLGMAGRDAENQYALGPVQAIIAESGTHVVYREDFDERQGLWRGSRGMTASVETAGKGSGDRCLVLNGSQEDAWGYGAASLPGGVIPGSKYRLVCRLRVDTIDPPIAPYLKLGVDDSEGNHLANYHTDRYDLDRIGTWQELSGVFEVGAQAAGGVISVEKGGRHAARSAVLALDGVCLEVLERP